MKYVSDADKFPAEKFNCMPGNIQNRQIVGFGIINVYAF